MGDKDDELQNADITSQLICAGISSAAIESAADVAKKLCMESGNMDADALNPRHASDYQRLFTELSLKSAK